MTIPIQIPQLGATGVAGVTPPQAHPDFGRTFLEAFLGAQTNKVQQQQVDIQRQQEERLAREQERKIAEAKASGDALRAILFGIGGQNPAQSPNAPPPYASMSPAAGPLELQPPPTGSSAPPPSGASAPGTPPAGTTAPGSTNPLAPLLAVLGGVPAESVAGVVHATLPVLMEQQKLGLQQEKLKRIDQMLTTVPADKRDAARAVVTFAELGANLPKEMQQTLWPSLFPNDGTNAPEAMNAFSTMFKTGAFTAGQAALTAGITLPPGTPTNIKYVPPVNPLAKSLMANRFQTQAANYATEMVTSNAAIDGYMSTHPEGLSFLGQLRKNIPGGGGILKAIESKTLNKLLKPDEVTVVVAMNDFVQGWAHATSGLRISDEQFARILHNVTEESGDPTQTKQYKKNMRSMMIQGVSDIAKGVRTPTQVINNAMTLPWSQDQKRMLQEMKGQATKFEQQQKAGTAPVGVSTGAPASPEDLQAQLDDLRHLLGASIATQPVPEP